MALRSTSGKAITRRSRCREPQEKKAVLNPTTALKRGPPPFDKGGFDKDDGFRVNHFCLFALSRLLYRMTLRLKP